MTTQMQTAFTPARNTCKLCTPLGATLAYLGIEGTLPFLHGSQGCATYIRRFLIGHFREPVDVACSSFTEMSAIFGGEKNLHQGLRNVTRQYRPRMIGVASTCLSETMGDDVAMYLARYAGAAVDGDATPHLVSVATPSYVGSYVDGFHRATRAVVEALAVDGAPANGSVNLFPGILSPADLRHLHEILDDFGLNHTMLPDYSDTLDRPVSEAYGPEATGGTPLAPIAQMGGARCSIALGATTIEPKRAGAFLRERFGVAEHRLGLPVGVNETDRFFELLSRLSERPVPAKHVAERGRLVDSYVDGHKYIFGKRVALYGEGDLVVGLAAFLTEIGAVPVLCASGEQGGEIEATIKSRVPGSATPMTVLENADFGEIEEACEALKPDLLVGSSKGFSIARKLQIPLVRAGFPIHDRLGGQRLLHVGYRGTQQLFDRILDAVIEKKQNDSPVGYTNM